MMKKCIMASFISSKECHLSFQLGSTALKKKKKDMILHFSQEFSRHNWPWLIMSLTMHGYGWELLKS